jgi:hypothetical protein
MHIPKILINSPLPIGGERGATDTNRYISSNSDVEEPLDYLTERLVSLLYLMAYIKYESKPVIK